MEELLKRLQRLDENGDEAAGNLYWEAVDIPKEQFPLWVAQNDRELRKVLAMDAILTEPDEEERKFAKAYQDLRNEGLSLFKGDKKLDPYGRPMKTLDDFMGAFGISGSNGGEYDDDDRAAFTNPENPRYWGNLPSDDRELAAISMGYESADEMARDLERAGNSFQIGNRVEGWDANNEVDVMEFIKSSLKGFALPRVKEAQKAGREPSWQDYTGDMAELGLNFVPGVGLVTKGGRVVSRIPGLKSGAGRMVVDGLGLVADQAVVPVGTQLVDANILYNPNVLGNSDSELNPRSEFDFGKAAVQTGSIASAKGTLKGSAMVGKNMLEQGMGNQSAGGTWRGIVDAFESIGEKTDDLIARRQLALDRKAELAKQRANVTLPGDRDITATASGAGEGATIDDLINAENYRILTSEAERIAKSKKAREAYRKALSGEEAAREITRTQYGTVQPVSDPALRKRFHEGIKTQENSLNKTGATVESEYRVANEDSPYKSLLITKDGRVIPRDYVTYDGEIKYPGTDYTFSLDEKLSPLDYKYDDFYAKLAEENTIRAPIRAVTHYQGIDNNTVARNPAVLKEIKKDDLLKRKLDPTKTALVEGARDTFADASFNVLAREGVVGNVTDFDKKREQALWNRMLTKLRPLTANSKLSVDQRKANGEAVMNVMQYGLDRLPTELYQQNPKVYKIIADNLGVKDWKHFSENDVQPTTSYSSSF